MSRFANPLFFTILGFITALYLPTLLQSNQQLTTTLSPLSNILNLNTNSQPNMSASLSAAFFNAVKNRRTYYPLGKNISVSKEKIEEIVKDAVLHAPSSFNSQSNRAVVLFGNEHNKLWDITTETLKPIVPSDQWAATAGKMAMFKGAAGTIMFFEDSSVVESFQAKFALYSDKFPIWATQSDAMVQFITWTGLEAEGLGANLQHYNPLIDAKVAETWKIPSNWKLNAQMVFGAKTGDAGDKVFKPVEENVKVFAS